MNSPSSNIWSRKPPTPAEFEAEWAARAETELAVFIRQAWPILEPGTAYLHNWHIDAIAEHLEAVTAGQITRLVINIPPRYMKSTAVTICWPAWEWLTIPTQRWIFASYTASLSTDLSVRRRQLLQSDWYQHHWGDRWHFAGDQNLKTEYQNDHRGVMTSVGMGGTVTGKGGNRIVVDDPHNPKKAESDAERQTALDFFNLTLSTRLNDKKRGTIVVVMQRLHEADITARCLALGYTHLCLPAEAKARTVITLPRSGQQIVREAGALLWPEREGPDEIAAQKTAMGSYGYAGQYDQAPAPPGGGVFKRHWWRFWHYPDSPLPPVVVRLPDGSLHRCPVAALPARRDPERGTWVYEFDEQSQSWDMAFKDLADSDFVVGQVWGRKAADTFLLDQVRGQWDLPATCAEVLALTARWAQTGTKLVEDKANGPAVIQTLRHKVAGLIPVEPLGGKIVRARAVSPQVEAGNVYLPHPLIAPWVDDLLGRLTSFPKGKDDEVDALTQQLARWTAWQPLGVDWL